MLEIKFSHLLANFFFITYHRYFIYIRPWQNWEVNKLNLISKDFCFCVELPIKAAKKKLTLISVPANERKRIAGKKS